MLKNIILTLLLFFVIPFSYLCASEIDFASGVKLHTSDTEKVFIKVFWNHVETLEFDKAVKLEKVVYENPSKYLYADVYFDIVRVIKKYRNIDDKTLRDFLMLEKDRLEWELFLFDESLSETEIVAHIDSVVRRLEAFNNSKKSSFIKDEVMYRLGLAYYTYGSFGFNRFKEAVELFYNIIEDYPGSDLVDDAEFGIIMTQINREYALGRVSASITSRINILKDFLEQNASSNKIVEARHKLAIEYYFARNHAASIVQYKKIIVSETRSNLMVLEVLKDLIDLCGEKSAYNCDHKKYIKVMEERFPGTEYAKWAKGRL